MGIFLANDTFPVLTESNPWEDEGLSPSKILKCWLIEYDFESVHGSGVRGKRQTLVLQVRLTTQLQWPVFRRHISYQPD